MVGPAWVPPSPPPEWEAWAWVLERPLGTRAKGPETCVLGGAPATWQGPACTGCVRARGAVQRPRDSLRPRRGLSSLEQQLPLGRWPSSGRRPAVLRNAGAPGRRTPRSGSAGLGRGCHRPQDLVLRLALGVHLPVVFAQALKKSLWGGECPAALDSSWFRTLVHPPPFTGAETEARTGGEMSQGHCEVALAGRVRAGTAQRIVFTDSGTAFSSRSSSQGRADLRLREYLWENGLRSIFPRES